MKEDWTTGSLEYTEEKWGPVWRRALRGESQPPPPWTTMLLSSSDKANKIPTAHCPAHAHLSSSPLPPLTLISTLHEEATNFYPPISHVLELPHTTKPWLYDTVFCGLFFILECKVIGHFHGIRPQILVCFESRCWLVRCDRASGYRKVSKNHKFF